MSGRGKGGNGLDKGEVKWHCKQVLNSLFGSQGWCEAYQWPDL